MWSIKFTFNVTFWQYNIVYGWFVKYLYRHHNRSYSSREHHTLITIINAVPSHYKVEDEKKNRRRWNFFYLAMEYFKLQSVEKIIEIHIDTSSNRFLTNRCFAHRHHNFFSLIVITTPQTEPHVFICARVHVWCVLRGDACGGHKTAYFVEMEENRSNKANNIHIIIY